MKEIIIKKQKELDALPDSFNQYQEIYINSDPNSWLKITKTPQNAKIILRESSHAVLWGSSHAVLRGNSSAKALDESVTIDKLLEQATLICIDKKCNIQKKERTATIIISPKVVYNIKSFCDIYGKNLISKKEIILYKTVRPENHRDFYTNSIEYKGEVVCPDFKDDPKIQCGYGLHLSPTPELALAYHKGTVLKCVVNIKDIVVFGTDITKVRCQKVEVIGEI